MENSTCGSVLDSVKGIFQTHRYPVLAILIVGLLNFTAWFFFTSCGADPHLKKARQSYEAGQFAQAASEAELFIANNPNFVDGYNILGDSHAALAEISRGGDFNAFVRHACLAINAYKKSLAIAYNNNIGAKVAVLEQQTQGLYDSEGKPYGCESTGTGSSQTGP